MIANRPVPETSWLVRRRALHGEALRRLAVVRLAQRVFRLDRSPARSADVPRAEALEEVVRRIFADLKALNEAKDSRLVLVYLPMAWDYRGGPETEASRAFAAREAERQGITLLDLVEEIRRVPPTEVDRLYAPNAHFSVEGNEWAARVLHSRLAPLLDGPASP